MCEPTTIAAAVTVVSAAYTAKQQYDQGKYQKGVADYNARVAENQAERTRSAGVEAENIQRRKTAELISKQRAQLGAANIDIGSGSALQLQEDAATLGEVDALRIRRNYEDQGAALDTSAKLTENQGEFAAKAGRNAAFGTLLSGTASAMNTGVSDKWMTPNSAANQVGTINTGQQYAGYA